MIDFNTIYEYIIQFWFAYLSKQNDVIRLYLQLCATISLSNFPLSKPSNSIPLKGWQYFVTCCVRECCSLESRPIKILLDKKIKLATLPYLAASLKSVFKYTQVDAKP